MSADRVLAIDNVPLDLPVAGAGTRCLAAFIDYLIVGFASVVLAISLVAAGRALSLESLWWLAVLLLALFALDYGFFAGFEIATRGQTPGKKLVGLRVVSQQGSRASAAAVLVRNAVRNLDLLIVVPLMLFDPLARRLGDRLAGTTVIRARVAARNEVHRYPKGWDADRIAVLESFLERRHEIEPEKADRIARSLLAAIERDDPQMLAPEGHHGTPVDWLVASVAPPAKS